MGAVRQFFSSGNKDEIEDTCLAFWFAVLCSDLAFIEAGQGPPDDAPLLALWGRAGVEPAVKRAGVLGFGLKDMLRQPK